MKKLLIHLDTDAVASAFDAVIAYDGGADHLIQYAGVTPDNCADLVDGAIYTRAPKDKKNTAIFVSGSDVAAGEALFNAVQERFFGKFRVSVMLDSNGCNTTAAAAVALLNTHYPAQDKSALILAGSGPVGQRAALMLAQCGANKVLLSSRQLARAQQCCDAIQERFGVAIQAVECGDESQTSAALSQCEIAVATGKTGIQLATHAQWSSSNRLQALADVNTRPPSGFEGVEPGDCATERDGKLSFGGLGVGGLKLRLQRACVAQLFDNNEQVLDAKEVLEIAQRLVAQ